MKQPLIAVQTCMKDQVVFFETWRVPRLLTLLGRVEQAA
jgi:hypothetical protein